MTAKEINLQEVHRLADELAFAIKNSKDTKDIIVLMDAYKGRYEVIDELMNRPVTGPEIFEFDKTLIPGTFDRYLQQLIWESHDKTFRHEREKLEKMRSDIEYKSLIHFMKEEEFEKTRANTVDLRTLSKWQLLLVALGMKKAPD